MKVLILQGSPRANGNTAWMAEEYKITDCRTGTQEQPSHNDILASFQ
jgi:multimeric flavodoxin WrbA